MSAEIGFPNTITNDCKVKIFFVNTLGPVVWRVEFLTCDWVYLVNRKTVHRKHFYYYVQKTAENIFIIMYIIMKTAENIFIIMYNSILNTEMSAFHNTLT